MIGVLYTSTKSKVLILPRVTSTFSDPNGYGFFLQVALALSLVFFLRNRSIKSICSLILITAGLAISYSRGAWIAAAVGFVSVVFFLTEYRFKSGGATWQGRVAFAIAIIGILLIGRSFISGVYSNVLSFNVSSYELRLLSFATAIKMFYNHPIIGMGYGTFINRSGLDIMVHNGFLEVLVATGILGFIPYISFFVLAFMSGTRTIYSSNSYFMNAASIGLVSGLVALSVNLLTLSTLSLKNLWLTLGILYSLSYLNSRLAIESNSDKLSESQEMSRNIETIAQVNG